MKILFLDLEISPTLGALWGLFNQTISIHNIVGDSEILCWSAKWLDKPEAEYSSLHMAGHNAAGKKRMLKAIHKLLDQADVVVTYNGDKFDLKILNQEFLLAGLPPPSPFKSVDLLKVMKRKFRWTSNKLDYVLRRLGLGHKMEHEGISMWLKCMNKGSEGYHEAWETMEKYNIQDVFKTEELYKRVLGWIPNHPSHGAFAGKFVCPNCGGNHAQSRGFVTSRTRKYRRFRCNDCGHWSRSNKPEPIVDGDNERLVQIV